MTHDSRGQKVKDVKKTRTDALVVIWESVCGVCDLGKLDSIPPSLSLSLLPRSLDEQRHVSRYEYDPKVCNISVLSFFPTQKEHTV